MVQSLYLCLTRLSSHLLLYLVFSILLDCFSYFLEQNPNSPIIQQMHMTPGLSRRTVTPRPNFMICKGLSCSQSYLIFAIILGGWSHQPKAEDELGGKACA